MTNVNLELAAAGVSVSFVMDDFGGLDYVVFLAQARGLTHYEQPYPALVAAIVAAVPGLVLDVGANTGLFSLLAASARSDAMVAAFEPLALIATKLEHNLALNPSLASRISVHALALSDRPGQAVFHETINPHGLFSTSSSLDRDFARAIGETREILVPIDTLDQWRTAHGRDPISFIKIDVEGHEPAMLVGAEATIAIARPIIGVELLGGADYPFFSAFLKRNAYVDCIATPDAMIIGEEPRFEPDGWNHLLLPRERIDLVGAIGRAVGLRVTRHAAA